MKDKGFYNYLNTPNNLYQIDQFYRHLLFKKRVVVTNGVSLKKPQ